uniref:Uncharacterized protein n=1 Tax=Heterorhabditis bacteriophora TaxID=37862 RepID=A0A1I7WKR1_HETBA
MVYFVLIFILKIHFLIIDDSADNFETVLSEDDFINSRNIRVDLTKIAHCSIYFERFSSQLTITLLNRPVVVNHFHWILDVFKQDRDMYIEIVWRNVLNGADDQFEKLEEDINYYSKWVKTVGFEFILGNAISVQVKYRSKYIISLTKLSNDVILQFSVILHIFLWKPKSKQINNFIFSDISHPFQFYKIPHTIIASFLIPSRYAETIAREYLFNMTGAN